MGEKKGDKKLNKKINKKGSGMKFLLPSLIGFSLLYILPLLLATKYSFQRSSFNSDFVGFHNYINMFSNQAFVLALKNTLVFIGLALPAIILLSFFISLAVFEVNPPKFVSVFIILPMVIPSGSMAGFFKNAFGTGANNILDSNIAMLIVLLLYLWRNTGYNMIIYLAGFSRIDKSIVEASDIDGISYWGKIRYIYWPLTLPATSFVGVVSIINSFKIFKDIFVLQGAYPNPHIYMLQHFLNNKFAFLRYEELTAAASIFTVIIFLILLIFLMLDKKYTKKIGARL